MSGILYNTRTVVLNRGDYTTCTINLHGATVTSWRFEDEEQLFLSRLSHFSGLQPPRGGISFVFPHFAKWAFGPKHGYARNVDWKLTEGPTKDDDSNVYATFTLENSDYTDSMWNNNFELMYKVTLFEKALQFEIKVQNLSTYYTFVFDILHHSLFKVPDVVKCGIVGFKGHKFKDQTRDVKQEFEEDRDQIFISERTDRIYRDVEREIILTNAMKGLKLEIGRNGQKDVNLWNPWEEGAIRLSDLGDDEYKYFIAVEAGSVLGPIKMLPLSCWKAVHTMRVVKRERKIKKEFYDLFEGLC